jgi:DNA polymerase I-like protein with 3'-5' exonuclease and polymerase domains
VRGRVSFSQARNTPFQGLAADGAKLALWNLLFMEYRVVAFIHDEVLVELPDRGGYVNEAQVRQVVEIMRLSMEEVTGNVPVGCEYTLSRRWSKDAKAVVKDGKVYPWEPTPADGGGT